MSGIKEGPDGTGPQKHEKEGFTLSYLSLGMKP
jgi:hypothetical protein